MNKTVLYEYIDACAVLAETEAEIERLEKKKNIVHDKVYGSNPEWPYEPMAFKIEGTCEAPGDMYLLRRKRELLDAQKKEAAALKHQVEVWLNEIPFRMRRIVRYKYFERLSWEEIADRMKARSGESLRKELEKFLK